MSHHLVSLQLTEIVICECFHFVCSQTVICCDSLSFYRNMCGCLPVECCLGTRIAAVTACHGHPNFPVLLPHPSSICHGKKDERKATRRSFARRRDESPAAVATQATWTERGGKERSKRGQQLQQQQGNKRFTNTFSREAAIPTKRCAAAEGMYMWACISVYITIITAL